MGSFSAIFNDAKSSIPWRRLAALDALLLAALLRLWNLGEWSLWYDETVSVYLAQKSLPEMLAHTAGDIHPPGYYALLHLWQAVVTPSPTHGLEFLYGFVSVAAGLVGLALLYALGRATVGENGALVALWLGAINPFQVWFSQEVRMYTVASALALLCLYATVRWLREYGQEDGRAGVRWLAVYALAAAAGLYTIYYFVFVLAGVGVASLILGRSLRRWLAWAGANGVALLLFTPWLGVFWRQATNPPVPPWRVPWEDVSGFLGALGEALVALLVGQTGVGPTWLWAIVVAAIVGAFVWRGGGSARMRWALAGFVLTPLAALFALTAALTPLYHVRYLFAFAAPFLLMAGAVVVEAWRRAQVAGGVAGGVLSALLVAGSLLGLWNYWSNPVFARDDHRGAVATLMREWRPGDVVLVNAGWAYTPLAVYWDEGASADWAAPPLADSVRLLPGEVTEARASALTTLPVVRSGSVEGAESLGWGSPSADFFAASSEETIAALEELVAGQDVARIWHYRIYDTVSDPDGLIRAWLDGNTQVVRDDAIAGRDFGRLELRALRSAPSPDAAVIARFGGVFDLLQNEPEIAPFSVVSSQAGTTVYVNLDVRFTPDGGQDAPPLAASLRLYDAGGAMVTQQDQGVPPPSEGWGGEAVARMALAVTLPSDMPPGAYSPELILYHGESGEAIGVESAMPSVDGQRLVLGSVVVEP